MHAGQNTAENEENTINTHHVALMYEFFSKNKACRYISQRYIFECIQCALKACEGALLGWKRKLGKKAISRGKVKTGNLSFKPQNRFIINPPPDGKD